MTVPGDVRGPEAPMRTPLALLAVLLLAAGTAAGEGSERMGLPWPDDLVERPGTAEALVQGLRDDAPPRVVIEAHALRIPEADALRLIPRPWPASQRLGEDPVLPVTAELARRLLREVAEGRSQQPHTFTSLPLAVGQAATFRASTATTYLQDYDAEIAQKEQRLAAIVGALEEGVLIQVTPEAGATLAVTIDWAELVRPIETFIVSLSGPTLRIQLPELRVVQANGRAPAAPGSWLLAGSGKAWDDGHLALVLLHVRAPRR
jgi:hypothetical protein